MTMNFGPLNREGGWRRLNVAVSRARREMVVFCYPAARTNQLVRHFGKGVAALKDFLSYAADGSLQETRLPPRKAHRPRNRAGYLQRTGKERLKTHCMVGHSQYRLDIGVIDPAHPGQYLLGILLDGNTYRDARTTRDRELAQEAVLEGLGWELHRIWTMDWLESRRKS